MSIYRSQKPRFHFFLATLLIFALAGCAGPVEEPPGSAQGAGTGPRVVATTTIVADVVRQVGGDAIQVSVLLPPGTDPHGFEPTPQEVARVADADLVFANGAGLEEFLQPLLDNAGGEVQVIEVSQGIDLIESQEAEHEGEGEEAHSVDPHTWNDPNNVKVWTQNIAAALQELDPENAALYTQNAAQYQKALEDLDAWIREKVEKVPPDERELVVDHQVFAYFAEEYGFEQVGAIVPSFSTMAEPSAQEIARLEDLIRGLNVKAIFVGSAVNPSLAERVAADTGARLVRLYNGSLSEEGGEADTYIEYMRYNVTAIVNALGEVSE